MVTKNKSIIISEKTHSELKKALGKKFKIGEVVEGIIQRFLVDLKERGEEILINK